MAFSHITFTTHCKPSVKFIDGSPTEPQGYVVIKDEDQQSTVYITATEKVRDDLARIVQDWSFAEEAEARGEDVTPTMCSCGHRASQHNHALLSHPCRGCRCVGFSHSAKVSA